MREAGVAQATRAEAAVPELLGCELGREQRRSLKSDMAKHVGGEDALQVRPSRVARHEQLNDGRLPISHAHLGAPCSLDER